MNIFQKVKQSIQGINNPEKRLQYITAQWTMGYNGCMSASEKKQQKIYKKMILETYHMLDKPNFTKKDIKKETDTVILKRMCKQMLKWLIKENKVYNPNDDFKLLH